jgi:hypothetical protein
MIYKLMNNKTTTSCIIAPWAMNPLTAVTSHTSQSIGKGGDAKAVIAR